MARVPLTRNSTGPRARVAQLAAGSNVTITENLAGDVLTVTVAASGGGGGGGTPASTVVSSTTFGQASAVGTSTDYARGDHVHGTPAIPAHSTLSSLGWTSSGHTGNAQSVPVFNGSGAAALSSPTADGQVLTRQGGALTWVTLATGLALFPELTEERYQAETLVQLGLNFNPEPGTL